MPAEPFTPLPGPPPASKYFPILRTRILQSDDGDNWDGLVARVTNVAAEAESRWDEPDRASFLESLADALRFGRFLPNSPALVNCGRGPRHLLACFAVDTQRPLDAFLDLVRKIHDGMGGAGFTLDPSVTAQEASVFIRRVDEDTVAHQDGRMRPASTAVTVSIESRAADALLELSGRLKTTNLNVAISDAFVSSADAGDASANEKLHAVARAIHATGQPGVLFVDRIRQVARDAAAPFAANVCGEAPLAADEAGVVGSVNLVQCLRSDGSGGFIFDDERFGRLVRLGVRFLDGILDLHAHSSPELMVNSLATRKIGIGIMGFAHALALLGIRYGEQESIAIAERIAERLAQAAQAESERLGSARGCFPAWHANLGVRRRRNATLAAIAPTSTLALLVGTTGGIEPVFSHVTRHTVLGRTVVVLDPIAEFLGRRRGISSDELLRRLVAGEPLGRIAGDDVARLLPRANDISGEQHIEVQAAFQRHIDGGIAKTVNCSTATSVEDILRWLRLAHRRGCMGLTIYRQHACAGQPMVMASGNDEQ